MSKHPEVVEILDDTFSQGDTASRTISPEPLGQQQPVAEEDTKPGPPAPHDKNNGSRNNNHADQTDSIIKIVPRRAPAAHQRANHARADSATLGAAPAKTTRLRGALLGRLGSFYPQADFHIHRVGDRDPSSDIEVQGEVLWALRTVFTSPSAGGDDGSSSSSSAAAGGAYYRVTMTAPYPSVPAAEETLIGWVNTSTAVAGIDAEEYTRILDLGCAEHRTAGLMMFTVHTPEEKGWVVARQIPGKEYSLEECLDVLQVMPECRQAIHEFGPKRWRVGDAVPLVYVCKDMSISEVTGKIRNIMRE